jgi:hypothetical protein
MKRVASSSGPSRPTRGALETTRGRWAMFITAMVLFSAVLIQIGTLLLPAPRSLFTTVGEMTPEGRSAAARANAPLAPATAGPAAAK